MSAGSPCAENSNYFDHRIRFAANRSSTGFKGTLPGAATALFALGAFGCGGEEEEVGAERQNEPSEAFSLLLGDLKEAASSDSSFRAVRRSKDLLDGVEHAAVDAFCETAWQLEINGETEYLGRRTYLVNRIRNLAEYDLDEKDADEVSAALRELDGIVDVASIDEA